MYIFDLKEYKKIHDTEESGEEKKLEDGTSIDKIVSFIGLSLDQIEKLKSDK